MGLKRGVEEGKFTQYLAVPTSRIGRKSAVPVGKRGTFGITVIILTEMNPKKNINERGAQFSDGDMRFPSKVNGLQRLKEPLTGTHTNFLFDQVGEIIRPK